MIGGLTSTGETIDWTVMSHAVWNSYVRPLAVGAMLMGAFYTLFNMRKSLITGIARVIGDMKKIRKEGEVENRLEKDLPYGATLISRIEVDKAGWGLTPPYGRREERISLRWTCRAVVLLKRAGAILIRRRYPSVTSPGARLYVKLWVTDQACGTGARR